MPTPHPRHPEIDLDALGDYWPGTSPEPYADIMEDPDYGGRWAVGMTRDGQLSLWPAGADVPAGIHVIYAHDDKERLLEALLLLCRRGYDMDVAYVHQGCAVYIFTCTTYTAFQLGMARRAIHLVMQGKAHEALVYAQAKAEQIDAAVRHELKRARGRA